MAEYIPVARVEEVPSGSCKLVQGIDRVDICVWNVDNNYYAVSNICPHKGAPLNGARRVGKALICQWHNAAFNLDSGRGGSPSPRALRTYEVKTEDGYLYVKAIPKDQNGQE